MAHKFDRSPLGDRIAQQREVVPVPDDERVIPLSRMEQEDEEARLTGDGMINTAALLARVGGPTLGGFLGPIGGAAGGFVGEGAAQLLERITGVRDEFNPKSIAVETALGAIPLSKVAKLSRLRRIGREAAKGAGIGGSASVAHQLAAEGEVDPGRAALDALLGGTMGGTVGTLATRGSLRGDQQGYKNLPADYVAGRVIAGLGGEPGVLAATQKFSIKALNTLRDVLDPSFLERGVIRKKFTPQAARDLQNRIRGFMEQGVPKQEDLKKMLGILEDIDLNNMSDVMRLKQASLPTHLMDPANPLYNKAKLEEMALNEEGGRSWLMKEAEEELIETGAFDRAGSELTPLQEDALLDKKVNELLGEKIDELKQRIPEGKRVQPLTEDIIEGGQGNIAGEEASAYYPEGYIPPDESRTQTLAKRWMQSGGAVLGHPSYALMPVDSPFLQHYTKPNTSAGLLPTTNLRPSRANNPDFMARTQKQDWVTTGFDMRKVLNRQNMEGEIRAIRPAAQKKLDDFTTEVSKLASEGKSQTELPEGLRAVKLGADDGFTNPLPGVPFEALTNYTASLGSHAVRGGAKEPILYVSALDEWGFNYKTSKGMPGPAKLIKNPAVRAIAEPALGESFVVYERIPIKLRRDLGPKKLGGEGVTKHQVVYDHAGAAQLSIAGEGNKGWNGVRDWETMAPSNLEARLSPQQGFDYRDIDFNQSNIRPHEALHDQLLDGINRGKKPHELVKRVEKFINDIDAAAFDEFGRTVAPSLEGPPLRLARDFVPKGERTAITNYIKKFKQYHQELVKGFDGERIRAEGMNQKDHDAFYDYLLKVEGQDPLLPEPIRKARADHVIKEEELLEHYDAISRD